MSLKTKYKYIEFVKEDDHWLCHNWRYKQFLGSVSYYARWKEWEFYPRDNTGYSVECCRDIADFLDQLNKAGKA